MKFVNPWFLMAVIPVLLIGTGCFIAAAKRRKQLLEKLLGKDAGNPRASTLSPGKRLVRFILLMLAIILMIIAAARPYVRTTLLPGNKSTRDILVLFDVSKSMRATDLPPSRLDQAKFLLNETLNAFPEDRFGLIPFAGNAFLSCPLTFDRHTLQIAVNELNTDSVPLGGTNLEKALSCAMTAFENGGKDHRAILLFTDGDELSGDASKVLSELKKDNIPLFIAGFGSPDVAAPVPDDNGGIMRSRDGELAGSKLNETLLRQIASETGGTYIRSTIGDTGINQVREFINRLNKQQEAVESEVPQDLFPYLTVTAFILLALAGLLGECKNKKAILLLVLLTIGAGVYADSAQLFQQALELQDSGDPKAAELYENLISAPETPAELRQRALHNLAVLFHSNARKEAENGQELLNQQNPNGALEKLAAAKENFDRSRELYSGTLDIPGFNGAVNNYQQMLLEKKDVETLEKKIRELLEQQKQTQQQTQQAQNENQQQQNQQNQQGQQQNQQNQQGQQQNQQNQQGQQQQNQQGQQADNAASEAEKLSGQAKELGQEKLANDAASAAEDLKEASKLQKEGKNQEAQKKLDDAAEKLQAGKEDDSQNGKEKDDTDSADKGEKTEEENNGTPQNIPEKENNKENTAKKDAARQLELLDDETGDLRDALREYNNRRRRRQVQKDW